MSPLPSRVKSPSRRCSWSCSEPFSECFPWTSCIGRILCWPWEFLPHIRPGGGTLESAFQQGLLLSLCIWELGNSFFLLHLKFLRTLTSQNPHLLSLLCCACFFLKSCRGVQFSADFHYRCSVCDSWFYSLLQIWQTSLPYNMDGKWAWNSKKPLKNKKKNLGTRSHESSGATCAVIVEITGAVDYLEIKSHKQTGCAISHKKIWLWEVLMGREKQGPERRMGGPELHELSRNVRGAARSSCSLWAGP